MTAWTKVVAMKVIGNVYLWDTFESGINKIAKGLNRVRKRTRQKLFQGSWLKLPEDWS